MDLDYQFIDMNDYTMDNLEEQKRGKWTPEEDDKLHKAIRELGPK